MKRTLIFIILITLAGLGAAAGLVIWIYHHHINYDLSVILKNPVTVKSVNKPVKSIPLSKVHHIFVIFEENHDWSSIYKNSQAPFINKTLLTQGAYAQNYHNISPDLGVLHPSEPAYIFAEAGKIAFADHTFTTDDPPGATNSTASHDHLTYLLNQNNLSWKSYQEDISGNDCPISPVGNYAPKHNPFVYFQDISGNPPSSKNAYCQSHIRPLTELQTDLASGKATDYIFITPNLVNDMHDGSIRQTDTWLAKIVPEITDSEVFKKDGVLFITWDESGGGDDVNNPVGMIILSPFVKPGHSNTLEYSHASLVKTIEEIFNLSPLLGFAADDKTSDLSDFFTAQ